SCGIALLVISFVILFIRNQNKLIRSRQQSHDAELAHQRELLSTIINSQENERKRIGQDLHDQVGGSLSNLRILINRLHETKQNENDLGEAIRLYKQLIDKIIEDMRNISHNLSPPALALFGFSEALEELKDIVCKGDDSFITILNHAAGSTEKLEYTVALALIRVLQELITNTLKHAAAKRIGISLFIENELLIIHYTDDGVGYDMEDKEIKKGMGIQNIESRLNIINARYTIKTGKGEGFSLFILIDPEKQNT
ncbi:MAG: sensor histidine kinase, partial [Mucilaginibacter sp.]